MRADRINSNTESITRDLARSTDGEKRDRSGVGGRDGRYRGLSLPGAPMAPLSPEALTLRSATDESVYMAT